MKASDWLEDHLLQMKIQDFLKEEHVGCRRYGYFTLVHFIVDHIMWCVNKNTGGQN